MTAITKLAIVAISAMIASTFNNLFMSCLPPVIWYFNNTLFRLLCQVKNTFFYVNFFIFLAFFHFFFYCLVMDMAKYIRMCCLERNNMQMKELAEKTEQTQQNLNNKLRSNNFKTSELEKIAAALGAHLEIKFIDNETSEPII